MDEELKKALADLGMTHKEAVEAQAKALTAFREESAKNDAARDAAHDEKLAKITAELDKFESLNQAIQAAESRNKEMQESLESIEAKLNRPGAFGDDVPDAKSKEYADTFMAWARYGDEAFKGDRKNVLQVGSDASAGYLATKEFVFEILKGITEVSPMRGLVTIRTTSHRSVQLPKRISRGAASWVSETGTRNATEGLAYDVDDIPVWETYMRVPISNHMLEDADFNMEDEIFESVVEGFGEQEGQAIISGNGSGKPKGILAATNGYNHVYSGLAASITADNVIDLKYAVKTGYARNASYILNRKSLGEIRKFKDKNNQYLWMPGLADGRPNTIDGDPYTEMPDMPDVAAGAMPIAYGDWKKAYTLVDRLDMTMLRDPYTLSGVGQVVFNWRRRLGGLARLGEAYAVLQVGVDTSL